MIRLSPSSASLTNRTTSVLLPTLALALIIIASGCKTAPANDASLSTTVQSRITSDRALANEPIQPSVQNGIVTLNGTVSSDAARSLAANDAAQLTGVRTVVNNLTVAPQQAAITPPPPLPQASTTRSSSRSKTSRKTHPSQAGQDRPKSHHPHPTRDLPVRSATATIISSH